MQQSIPHHFVQAKYISGNFHLLKNALISRIKCNLSSANLKRRYMSLVPQHQVRWNQKKPNQFLLPGTDLCPRAPTRNGTSSCPTQGCSVYRNDSHSLLGQLLYSKELWNVFFSYYLHITHDLFSPTVSSKIS